MNRRHALLALALAPIGAWALPLDPYSRVKPQPHDPTFVVLRNSHPAIDGEMFIQCRYGYWAHIRPKLLRDNWRVASISVELEVPS